MSNVMPRIVGVLLRGMIVSYRRTIGCLLDSRLSGVNKITDDFCGDANILLLVSHYSIRVM